MKRVCKLSLQDRHLITVEPLRLQTAQLHTRAAHQEAGFLEKQAHSPHDEAESNDATLTTSRHVQGMLVVESAPPRAHAQMPQPETALDE